jgi:nicotinamidase-related amidase
LEAGFKVKLLNDAIKGVNVKPKDSQKAVKEMTSRGAKKTTYEKVKRSIK